MNPEVFETKNAQITYTKIEIEDHGILTLWIGLDYGGTAQAFGGYDVRRNLSTWVQKIFEVLEVREWDDIKGKTIRVKSNHSSVYAIGHFMKDKWFAPKEIFK